VRIDSGGDDVRPAAESTAGRVAGWGEGCGPGADSWYDPADSPAAPEGKTLSADFKARRIPPVAHRASLVYLSVVLGGLWLVWSGHYTGLLLSLGLASVLGVVWLCRRMGIVDNETIPVHLVPRLVRYAPWLAWQVVLANVEVIRRILFPRPGDRTETVVVRGGQRTDVGRATYANSITLTPGTITVDVTGDVFTVHALTRASADGVYAGEMDREVSRLEGAP
jgi:multicomponent Na+:H+ antiporter subunit E